MVFAIWTAPALLQRFRFLGGFLDGADHVKSLLGELVVLSVHNRPEAADRVLQRHVLARRAREGFGDVKRLREKALDLARAGYDQLVLRRELVHAEDRDDIAQLL